MRDLLHFIVTSLVTNPDAVSIEEQNEGGDVTLNLTVDPQDMGLIIGKNGQTIRSLRKLLTVRAIAENVRITLQLVEPQGGSKTEKSTEEEIPQESPESSEEPSS